MKALLFRACLLAVAVWQVEMAVNAGIAASRRPARTTPPQPTNKASAPACTGPLCPAPQSQSAPQRVIIRSQ